ncbi:Rbl2p NDAI_0E00980 [Naumovozyma dairenensis CBS 421]|uniref:Tubulin-specific chaperone A n=1 Tax=Naumovozyma dairenensis (strain ATCC 10597 / BCRC 20456 / CBS 421 / NBRC 0211 / NRRL Y-12639) TaxID=1071378 RepID=G0WAZ4_NAUDC|nr:hypothetical protein NDAI_0E00980 [Naumovozyma dairenensis CBS 421]CCD24914.1 hypothetical protein NDAI_0E00980 [Naumovozyma dairenensis CBS 421]
MAPTQLEIKTKALQRLIKEESYYKEEIKEQKANVEKLKQDSNVDPYDLKKQVEVLEDTERLLPTLYTKIEEFKENLEQFLQSYDGQEDLTESKAAVEEANAFIQASKK